MALMPPRLILALALSLALHGGLLLPDILKRLPVAPPRPALQALLRPLPEPPVDTPSFEPLIKNTLDENTPNVQESPILPPAGKPKVSKVNQVSKRELRAVEKKLSKYIFYPARLQQLGIEGTVLLYVELLDDGRVEDVRVVTSSGSDELDNAAIKGFYAVGWLPGKSDNWAYTFRLVP